MKFLDLFSGIGGFSLGLERAGMETVAFCEYDKKCQLVLKKHWPEVPIYDDVRTLTGKRIAEEIGAIDLICGGFPCQPFSLAGKREGAEDDRHLWPEYFRLIQEIRPRWVIGENVAGLINMGLDQVLSDLESEDYSCQTLVIPACAVNAPHRRDRVWIVGHSESRYAGQPKEQPENNQNREDTQGFGGRFRDEFGGPGQNVPDTMRSGRDNGSRGRIDTKESQGSARKWVRMRDDSLTKGNSVNGKCEQWDVESRVGRVANGVPNRLERLKQLGNAVVPILVEVLGNAIMEIERNFNVKA